MNKKEIKQAIRTIGLALSANHGNLAIDDGTDKSTEINWRVDNGAAIEALEKLEAHLGAGGE